MSTSNLNSNQDQTFSLKMLSSIHFAVMFVCVEFDVPEQLLCIESNETRFRCGSRVLWKQGNKKFGRDNKKNYFGVIRYNIGLFWLKLLTELIYFTRFLRDIALFLYRNEEFP